VSISYVSSRRSRNTDNLWPPPVIPTRQLESTTIVRFAEVMRTMTCTGTPYPQHKFSGADDEEVRTSRRPLIRINTKHGEIGCRIAPNEAAQLILASSDQSPTHSHSSGSNMSDECRNMSGLSYLGGPSYLEELSYLGKDANERGQQIPPLRCLPVGMTGASDHAPLKSDPLSMRR
jgi:hypothetical protein